MPTNYSLPPTSLDQLEGIRVFFWVLVASLNMVLSLAYSIFVGCGEIYDPLITLEYRVGQIIPREVVTLLLVASKLCFLDYLSLITINTIFSIYIHF